MEIDRSYYIDLIEKSGRVNIPNLKDYKLLDLMSRATSYVEYLEVEDYLFSVDKGYFIPLMTFNCKGSEPNKLISNLIKYGFNYENILCIGNSNHKWFNKALSIVEKEKDSLKAYEYLINNLYTQVVVVAECSKIEDYLLNNNISNEELCNFYIPTFPIENELGITQEMENNYYQLEIKYRKIADMPLYEDRTFMEMLAKDQSIENTRLVINLIQRGKAKNRVKGIKWVKHITDICNLSNVFYGRTNKIHNSLRDT